MKKIIEKEVIFCDQCEKEKYVSKCLYCGVEHCFECAKSHGEEYPHAVYFSGSYDGYYCHSCNSELTRSRADTLHNMYSEIKRLRAESVGWSLDFKARSNKAETKLKSLLAF